ncbi:MAG: aryl-sulfate sulfotransferase [Candidatus Aminicenantes bacterium]|nr:aryl-sulfate sulfotransferase [Candidatus Aminicenantes bacterium]
MSYKSSLLILLLVLSLLFVSCGKKGQETKTQEDTMVLSTDQDQGEGNSVQTDKFILYAPGAFKTTYLVDASNQPVYQWTSTYEAGQSAFLLDDGSLLRPGSINNVTPDNRFVAAYRDAEIDVFNIGGIFERITKDNKVAWSFKYYSDDYAPHHLVTVIPNGNLLFPVWRYHTEEESIELGRDPKHVSSGGLWMESLIEMRPTDNGAEIVWEWNIKDHLIQDFDETKANYGQLKDHPNRIDINWGRGYNLSEDFIHVNSAFYIKEYDQIVMTSYHYSELWVIDHSTTTKEAAGKTGGRYGRGGELLYRWGNPWVYGNEDSGQFLLSAVHDPKWVAEKRHFIMYDNNVADPSRKLKGGNSMVVEIAPPIQPDGSYVMEGGIYGPLQPVMTGDLGVQATSVGTAQRMADGTILSCDCTASKTIWIDEAGKIISTSQIWENTTKDADSIQVYRLVGYAKDDPGVLALGLGVPKK